MPRRSRASLNVIPGPYPVYRPEPPAEFTDAEKTTWNEVVEGMRDSWFSKATLPMLRGYCALVRQADEVARDLRKVPANSKEGRLLGRQFRDLLASMAVIGTKLRVCPSSNKSTKDGQRRGTRTLAPRPWEDRDDDHRKPWEDDDGNAA
jgi:hypothetical protein